MFQTSHIVAKSPAEMTINFTRIQDTDLKVYFYGGTISSNNFTRRFAYNNFISHKNIRIPNTHFSDASSGGYDCVPSTISPYPRSISQTERFMLFNILLSMVCLWSLVTSESYIGATILCIVGIFLIGIFYALIFLGYFHIIKRKVNLALIYTIEDLDPLTFIDVLQKYVFFIMSLTIVGYTIYQICYVASQKPTDFNPETLIQIQTKASRNENRWCLQVLASLTVLYPLAFYIENSIYEVHQEKRDKLAAL